MQDKWKNLKFLVIEADKFEELLRRYWKRLCSAYKEFLLKVWISSGLWHLSKFCLKHWLENGETKCELAITKATITVAARLDFGKILSQDCEIFQERASIVSVWNRKSTGTPDKYFYANELSSPSIFCLWYSKKTILVSLVSEVRP